MKPASGEEQATQDCQRTLAADAEVSGIGLHTGRPGRIRIRPAPPDEGLTLRKVDRSPRVDVPVGPGFLVPSRRCTALGSGDVSVMTVEHLLAALVGLQVDNAVIEVEGDEVPAADGSALPFVQAVLQAGLVEQPRPRRVRRLRRAVWVGDGDRLLLALPAEGFHVAYAFVSEHPGLGDQYAQFSLSPEVFARELAPARTVAFVEEVPALWRQGLGLGGRADGVVLVGPEGVLGELRFPDEVVRHKILDLVGDLALVGPLSARIVAVRTGHAMNHELARQIARQLSLSGGA